MSGFGNTSPGGVSKQYVTSFATLASFPATGVLNAVYIASDTGYGYTWNGSVYRLVADPTGGSDKNFTMTFSGDFAIVNHNLNKYPSIQIFDNSMIQIEGAVLHNTLNQAYISFNQTISGTIICN